MTTEPAGPLGESAGLDAGLFMLRGDPRGQCLHFDGTRLGGKPIEHAIHVLVAVRPAVRFRQFDGFVDGDAKWGFRVIEEFVDRHAENVAIYGGHLLGGGEVHVGLEVTDLLLVVLAAVVSGSDGAAGAAIGAVMVCGVFAFGAVVLGAFMKFVLTEGLARWQLATGETVVHAWVTRLPTWVTLYFAGYLLLWTFLVGASLSSACGLGTSICTAAVLVAGAATAFGLGRSLGLGDRTDLRDLDAFVAAGGPSAAATVEDGESES